MNLELPHLIGKQCRYQSLLTTLILIKALHMDQLYMPWFLLATTVLRVLNLLT